MKTLYESILDSDKTVMSKTRSAIIPKLIVDTLRDKVGEPTGRTSKITKICQWYLMGYLDAEYIDEDDLKRTQLELGKHIGKFRDELFKDQNIRVNITDDIDKFQTTYNHRYSLVISYLDDTYKIDITLRGNHKDNTVESVIIWTDNREISKLVD